MANGIYGAFKQEQFGDAAGPGHGAVDWEADTIEAKLCDAADHTHNLNTDQDEADITAAIVASAVLASKTAVLSGNTLTLDATDTTFTSVTGDQSEEIIILKDAGGATTANLLIVYFDTFASGMPVTPNGGDIDVAWNGSGIVTV